LLFFALILTRQETINAVSAPGAVILSQVGLPQCEQRLIATLGHLKHFGLSCLLLGIPQLLLQKICNLRQELQKTDKAMISEVAWVVN
jgi:hypothetical protein